MPHLSAKRDQLGVREELHLPTAYTRKGKQVTVSRLSMSTAASSPSLRLPQLHTGSVLAEDGEEVAEPTVLHNKPRRGGRADNAEEVENILVHGRSSRL